MTVFTAKITQFGVCRHQSPLLRRYKKKQPGVLKKIAYAIESNQAANGRSGSDWIGGTAEKKTELGLRRTWESISGLSWRSSKRRNGRRAGTISKSAHPAARQGGQTDDGEGRRAGPS